jgi:hypothetical protein
MKQERLTLNNWIDHKVRNFLIHWYYFWGNLISKIMNYGVLGHLYPIYNRWMVKSSEYDINNELWKKPTNSSVAKPKERE